MDSVTPCLDIGHSLPASYSLGEDWVWVFKFPGSDSAGFVYQY